MSPHFLSETLLPKSGQFPMPPMPNAAVVMGVQGPLARSPEDLELALSVLAGADVGEDDLAALPESTLAPITVAISDACGSEPQPSRDLDACGWCGSDQLFRPAESGRVYCQNNGCHAVYNPSTGHWHLGDRTKPAATTVPEPTPHGSRPTR